METAGKPAHIAQGSDYFPIHFTSAGSAASCCSDSDMSTAASDTHRALSNSKARARSPVKRMSRASLVNQESFVSDASISISNEGRAPSDSEAKTIAIVRRMRRVHHLRASESHLSPTASFGSDDSMTSLSSVSDVSMAASDASTTASNGDKKTRTRNILLKHMSNVSRAAAAPCDADMSMVASDHRYMARSASQSRLPRQRSYVTAPPLGKTWDGPKVEEVSKMQKQTRRLAKVEQRSKPQPEFSRERRMEALRALMSKELEMETR